MTLRHFALLAAFVLITLAPMLARADTTIKRLAPGVVWTQEIDKTTPLIINVLDVDLHAPGVHVGVGIGQDRVSGTDATRGREDVSRYARRHHALAVVNADFFPFTGDPLGVGIANGELFSEPWTGNAKGGPRTALGLGADGRTALMSTLGFLGDLQAADNARYFINGINRQVGAGEIVVFSPRYGPITAYRKGGAEVTLGAVNGTVQADKLMVGRAVSVQANSVLPAFIPEGGLVLSAGPGAGAAFLQAHCHVGDKVGFVLSVAPPAQTHDGIKIASLPFMAGSLPSRGMANIGRGALLWSEATEAVGGGPRLLVNGETAIDGQAEGFDAGFTDHAYPRTAVGISRDGRHLIVVTADGRQALSRGATLGEMAGILKRYGAWNAMNFDGGGSTSLAVAGLSVNSPEGSGAERPVADMLVVQSDFARVRYPVGAPLVLGGGGAVAFTTQTDAQIVAPAVPVIAGNAVALHLRVAGRDIAGSDPRIVWQGGANGTGFVSQKGYFLAQNAGKGMLAALFDGQLVTGNITVQAKTPPLSTFALRADMVPDPQGASSRSSLFVRVLDKNSAPKAGASIHVIVTNGTVDRPDAQTDPDGGVTLGITWNQARGGSVQIVSPGLAPVTLAQPSAPF